jgi:L-malate glycosyltransferase
MKSATVFALPSIREGFGIVVLEANSCGLPVVTVDHPDNAARHLITDGQNGFLANVDPVSLAQVLSVAMIRAPLMDPRTSAERNGHLRDWDEVATSVFHTATDGRWALPDSRFLSGEKVTESA